MMIQPRRLQSLRPLLLLACIAMHPQAGATSDTIMMVPPRAGVSDDANMYNSASRTLSEESENKNKDPSQRLADMLDQAVSDTIGSGVSGRSFRSSEISQPVTLYDPSRNNYTSGFTSFFEQGSKKFERENVKVDFSFNIVGCLCLDVDCKEKVAADLVGIQQGNSLQFRGYSPIIFFDENGENVPCGVEAIHMPHHAFDEIVVPNNCGLTHFEDGTRITNCPDIDPALFYAEKNDILVARMLTNEQRIPYYSGARDSVNYNMAENYEDQVLPNSILDISWWKNLQIPNPIGNGNLFNQRIGFEYNLGTKAKNFIEGLIEPLVNQLSNIRPDDFNEDNGNIWRRAPLHAFTEVMDAFTFTRLRSLERAVASESMELLAEQIPYFGVVVQGLPEAPTEEELLSTGGLFLVAVATFGMGIGSLWRKLSSKNEVKTVTTIEEGPDDSFEASASEVKNKNWVKTGATLFLSFFLLVLEGMSMYVSWGNEQEQSEYSRTVASVEIIMADRLGGVFPLLVGSDGRMFFVVTKLVEVTDNTSDLTSIFYGIWGASAFAFIVMIILGRLYDLE